MTFAAAGKHRLERSSLLAMRPPLTRPVLRFTTFNKFSGCAAGIGHAWPNFNFEPSRLVEPRASVHDCLELMRSRVWSIWSANNKALHHQLIEGVRFHCSALTRVYALSCGTVSAGDILEVGDSIAEHDCMGHGGSVRLQKQSNRMRWLRSLLADRHED